MTRPLRVEYPGAIYHVTVRGNAQQTIFNDAGDRYLFYSHLAESVRTYGVRLFAFCLMDNHFHLVVATPGGGLGRFMQSVLTGYSVCYNLRHRCHGHLTQGRYGARLVAGDEYLLKLSRYVHLNPVKVKRWVHAPMAERIACLRQYEWSSYRSYVEQAKRLEWVDYGPMQALVGGQGKGRAERYRQFVEEGMIAADEVFLADMSRSARSIGDDKFREWVDERHTELLKQRRHPEDVSFRHATGKRLKPDTVLEAVAAAGGTTVAGLKARRRNSIWKGIGARLLVRHAGLTERECAGRLGLKAGSAVSYQIKKAGTVLETDAALARCVAHMESRLKAEAEK